MIFLSKILDLRAWLHYNLASLYAKVTKSMHNNRFFSYYFYFGSLPRVPLAVFKRM